MKLGGKTTISLFFYKIFQPLFWAALLQPSPAQPDVMAARQLKMRFATQNRALFILTDQTFSVKEAPLTRLTAGFVPLIV